LDSRIPLGFIYKERGQAAPFSPPVDYLIPHLDLLSRELVEEAHASARKIMTWTVNRSEDMLRFAGWGVDAMISDETELLVHSFR
ncbi:MAG: glycerophosphodiester phosphodiesterase, partial [Terriglobales bacterium]